MKKLSIFKIGFLLFVSIALASCTTSVGFDTSSASVEKVAVAPKLINNVPTRLIQDGSIRVGVVLPLSKDYGRAIKNALEMAIIENKGAKILMIVENSSSIGARAAARNAIAKGAEIILGPVNSNNVRVVGLEARAAGIPVIAFSNDRSAAGNGVYLQSLLYEREIQQVVAYSAGRGYSRFASLTANKSFGKVAASAFKSAANKRGTLVAASQYSNTADVRKFFNEIKNANVNAIFLPNSAKLNSQILKTMRDVGFDASGVKFIGTSQWNDSATRNLSALSGGWFANVNASALNRFNSRYAALFGKEPNRRAALGYDAMSLVAALGRKGQAGSRFSASAIQRGGGFGGILGHYSYSSSAISNYSLSIMQVGSGGFRTVSGGGVASN